MQKKKLLVGAMLLGVLGLGSAVQGATVTTTTTVTITATPSGTTGTATYTPTFTATRTVTPTFTASPIVSWTCTPTVTRIATWTCTPTFTVSPVVTNTPTGVTVTTTPLVTVTPTVTTYVLTPIVTATPDGQTFTAQATPTTTLTAVGTTLTPYASPTSYPNQNVCIRHNIVRPNSQQPVVIGTHLEKSQQVCVRIYNKRGQLIKTLYDNLAQAGTFETTWQGVNAHGKVVASGVYFVHIKTETFEEKRKVMVLK